MRDQRSKRVPCTLMPMATPRKPEICFETKEQSNARREREFLALSPSERLLSFLRCFEMQAVPNDSPGERKGNFIIERRRKDATKS